MNKKLQKKLVLNDYLKRNLTVKEISTYRKICDKTISKWLKDSNVLLSTSEKKTLRQNFDLKTVPYELRTYSYYYVYGLIDPSCNELFYIGKGKNDRYKDHMYEPRNQAKKDRIAAIEKQGLSVKIHFFGKDLTEEKSLELEMSLIQSHEGLLNVRKR